MVAGVYMCILAICKRDILCELLDEDGTVASIEICVTLKLLSICKQNIRVLVQARKYVMLVRLINQMI